MKTITVTCLWESRHEIEVPDDFNASAARLNDFPKEALEEMTPVNASLVDWWD